MPRLHSKNNFSINKTFSFGKRKRTEDYEEDPLFCKIERKRRTADFQRENLGTGHGEENFPLFEDNGWMGGGNSPRSEDNGWMGGGNSPRSEDNGWMGGGNSPRSEDNGWMGGGNSP